MVNEDIRQLLAEVETGMLDFLPDADYTEASVKNCLAIMTGFLANLESAKSPQEGRELVRNAVLSLNRLNEAADYEFIETDAREQLCEIFILASNSKGFCSPDEDITEAWREW